MNHQASYKTREEKAELLMQIDQLRDEKEDLVTKAINLSQSIKTLKTEVHQREDIASQLKRENRELKQTLSAAAHGKRYEMYTPIEATYAIHDGPIASKFSHQGSAKNSRAKSGKTQSTRRSTSIKSKTPIREAHKTLEEHHQQAQGHTPGGHYQDHYHRHDMNSDQKLNRLINEYKMENERTSQKINDLKDKLTLSQSRGNKRRSPGKNQQQQVYSKSFKGGYGGGD